MLKVYTHSLGCKVNLADLATIVNGLPDHQYQIVSDAAQAQIALLNTCTVTHRADRDVRKILGALGRDHPNLPVILTGCAAKLDQGQFSAFANVKQVIGPSQPEAVAKSLGDWARSLAPTKEHRQRQASPYVRIGRRRAFIKVQDGCNAHCAYCVIPQVRGRERSVTPEQLLDQLERLLDQGHHEFVLCGIHLGRYGTDQKPKTDLPSLLDTMAEWMGDSKSGARLRLSSIEPMEWSESLRQVIAKHDCICRHFHVPMQSGDDAVLRAMRRPYGRQQFAEVIETLRAQFPMAALGTDVLVGFPGESNQAAQNTQALVEALPLSYLHVFPFSARQGTDAAKMTNPVPPTEIKQRAAALRQVGKKQWDHFLRAACGKTHRVLVEKSGADGLRGRSASYLPFRIVDCQCPVGEIVSVRAERIEDGRLLGQVSDLAEKDEA